MMAISCECGTDWIIRYELTGYKGEIVLFCPNCKEMYWNAQEFFDKDNFEGLEYTGFQFKKDWRTEK
jgi:hypothetical protein